MILKTLGRVAAALGFLALAAAPAQAKWLEAKSPHFTVIGDMSEAQLKVRALDLERYSAALRFAFGLKDISPVTVYVVRDIVAVQEAAGGKSRNIAGFYFASAQGANAVVPETIDAPEQQASFTPQLVLFHEYAHHVLLGNVGLYMPGWAQEGLAEMFSTAKLADDGSVAIGAPDQARREEILSPTRWSVERMLDSDFHPPKDRDEEIEKYSRGWTMVHYLWLSGARPGQYVAFIQDVNRTIDPVASGKKVFGDLGKLDHELDSYVRTHKFKGSVFTEKQLGAPPAVTIHPMTEGEAAMLSYRLVSTIGVDEDAGRRLAERARPVAARYPNDARVQTWLAEMEHDAKNYDASWAAADRALALDPTSLFGMVYKGRVLMRRAIAGHDPQLAAQARTWFLKANKANLQHPLPFMLYYDSFGAMGAAPPADAVAGLYHAVELVPQDESLHIRAALALIREGRVANARIMLAPAAFQAEGTGENNALKLIRTMNETQDPKVLLARAAELKLDQVNDFIDPPKDEKDKGQSKSKVVADR